MSQNPHPMDELTKLAQQIVEQEFGTGVFKPDWKQGEDFVDNIPVLWTSIECSQCKEQVYFDKRYRRHRCSNCGFGF